VEVTRVPAERRDPGFGLGDLRLVPRLGLSKGGQSILPLRHLLLDRPGLASQRLGLGSRRLAALGEGDGPAPLAVCPVRQEPEELLEPGEGERGFLADLHVRQVVVPDPVGRPSLREEEEIGLHAGPGRREDAG
jgi:hypothetical protein